DPRHAQVEPIADDERGFEDALGAAKKAATTPRERSLIREIESGYQRYHRELGQLPAEARDIGEPPDFRKLSDAHPIRHAGNPWQKLLQLNKEEMQLTSEESEDVADQARTALLWLGVVGPIGGLIGGFGIARGLSRSIHQLSIRVQGMAQRLDQEVGSVQIAPAKGDLDGLDAQVEHVYRRIEEMAERLQRHQRDMLRAEQLAAVGQLAAGVAHEVRNPLTAIKLLVESALRPRQPRALTAEDLQVIHGEIVRLEQTVQGFLDFARPPRLQPTRCDLGQVVTHAGDLIRSRARQQGVEVILSLPEEPVDADIDPGQVNNVLVNLFLNALDAMPR